jgi:hypothetical protein
MLAPAKAVTLRYTLKKGAVVQYTVRLAAASRTSGMGDSKSESTMEMTSVYRLKVLEVAPNGDMLADLVPVSGTVKVVEGEETKKTSLPKAKPLHLKVTPLGAISVVGPEDWEAEAEKADVSFGVGSTTPRLDLLSAASIVPLPEGDVKVGDSWETEFEEALPLPALPGSDGSRRLGQVKVKSQLLEISDYKGRKCARIRTTYGMPIEIQSSPAPSVTLSVSGAMTGSMEWLYDYDRSCTISCQSTLQMLMKATADLPPALKERVPAGVNTDGTMSMKANLKASLSGK